MDEKIYILMATYNGEKYLKEQIDSLFSQTYQNWKLIIHDDNSKDKTVKIIKDYQGKYADKIKLLEDNISTGGAKENFTYLLNNIDKQYDYIMFCDQDDIWLENKIEITLNKMLEVEKDNSGKAVLIHTDLKVVDEELNIISNSMFRYQKLNLYNVKDITKISLENIITGCTMMLNKQLAAINKKIPQEAIMHDWWIAIITLKENGIIEFVNYPTILYRQHAFNTIGSKKVNFLYYLSKLLKINEQIKNYKSIYSQYVHAGVKIDKLNFVFMKSMMVLKKVLK